MTSSNSKDDEGIVVLGMPRSGTTLLQRILDAHPRIDCPTERYLLIACSRFLYQEPSMRGMSAGVLPGLSFAGCDEEVVVDRLRDFALSFFRESAKKAGKQRWAEKTAFDIFHIDNIERMFAGSCRFICLFRHALDVVCSMRELCSHVDRYDVELRPYLLRHWRPLEAFAAAWADQNTRLLQLLADHPDRCISLRYEQLTDDPAAQLHRVFDFLKEDVDVEELLKRTFASTGSVGLGDLKTFETNRIHSASIGRWKELSQDTINRLAPIVNPTMKEIGYEPVATNDEDDEAARRRYELGIRVLQMKSQLSGSDETSE